MPTAKILIVGAGVAGSVLAFWLAKNDPNLRITVIERSRATQKLGQGIEIEEPALQVVKAMGIMDKLHAARTGEMGCRLLDERGREHGYLPIEGEEGQRFSPTGALEMMRGDLTDILFKAANEFDNVDYWYECTLRALVQQGEKVVVEIQKRSATASEELEFDLVIGADGARSRTRQLLMGSSLDCYKPIGAFVAYFSVPKEERDWPDSKFCQFPGRRVLWLRPTGEDSKQTSVYLIKLTDRAPKLQAANATGDRMQQKQAIAELFQDCGWEAPRVIEQMMKSDNFYSDELAQVKLDRWSQGRVVLLGDAAWAPTPFTGQGNQLAIIGAWVLAQELSRSTDVSAFERYDKRLRRYVRDCQKIPLGGYAPYMCCPETALGIWVFQKFFGAVSWLIRMLSGSKLASILPEGDQNTFDLEI